MRQGSVQRLEFDANLVAVVTAQGPVGRNKKKELRGLWEDKMKMIRKKLSRSVLSAPLITPLVMGAVFANPALAQEDAEDEVSVMDKVVITATKRETDLQDTALSVGQVSGDDLENRGVQNALDAAQEVVGVVVQIEDEQRTARVTVRGVGSNQTGIAIEPSVGVLVDGEVYARTPSAVSNLLLDVQRVEVLRGPQGTLFGRNTSAGAIQTITKRPNMDEFEGQAVFGIEERGEYRVKGTVSGPLGDGVGFRLNGFFQHRDGHIENVVPGSDYDITGSDAAGVRAQLQFEPTSNLSVLLRADHSESEGLPGAQVFENLAPGNIVRGVLEDFGVTIGPDNDQAGLDRTAFRDVENTGLSAEFNWTLGGYDLKYMSFYRDWRLDENRDSTFSPIIAGTSAFGGFVETETYQQELHLVSPETEKYDYIVGLFLYDAEVSRDASNNRCTSLPNPNFTFDPVTFVVVNCPFAANGIANLVNSNSTSVETENYAIFGELNYRPVENLNLIIGGRLLQEDVEFSYFGGARNINDNGGPLIVTNSDTEFTYKLGAQYHWAENINTYFTYATGYKGVAFNSTINATEADIIDPPRPETSEQFEIGLRSELFDDNLRFNLTAFHTKFEGFQERFVEAITDPVTEVTTFEDSLLNTDELTSKGVELETEFTTPIEGLTGTFSAAYVDATFGDNPDIFTGCPVAFIGSDDCVQVGGAGPLRLPITDRDLPRSPDWQFITRWNYETTIFNDIGWSTDLSYKWVDSFSPDIQQRPQWAIPEQDTLELTTTFTSPDGKYALTVFGKNLLDDRRYFRIFTPGGAQGGAGGDGQQFGRAVILPKDFERYFGANLRVRF